MKNNKEKPLILITNDDGITSKGIRVLVEEMCKIGEVAVVAPNSPQSGMGHAITIGEPLRLHKNEVLFDGAEAYECSGTPADCVKISKQVALKDRIPDIVLSGINHGTNSSISVLYSGTMSAAIEASIEGVPAVGLSLCDYSANADFSHVRPWVAKIVRGVLANGVPKHLTLNVNFPKISDEPIKGIKVCRQAHAKWEEEFEERQDPLGKSYYWMSGTFRNFDKGTDNDEWAIENNYVSVVPVQYDLTAYHAISVLEEWGME